jgi:group II intron reverse transcriptase/maturase
MIEEVLNPWNLMRAYRRVVRNGGAAGVDGMGTESLYAWWEAHREEVKSSSRGCTYLPQPILGVSIPKPVGRRRQLGIPTVADRMLQQAVGQVLCNHFEMSFEDGSYGFRPNRNAHQAVRRSPDYINSGHDWIVDIDLKNFFDEAEHSLLLQILYRKVKCRATLRLIRKWLRSPIQIEGKLEKRRRGMPQGSPLSPILSNILLDLLDKKLREMGVKYVRYADDFSIYCREKGEAESVQAKVYEYLRQKLHLPVNESKSGLRRPEEFTILGYGFKPATVGADGLAYRLTVSEKSLKSLKAKLKAVTRKTKPYTFDQRMSRLKEIQQGWVQYFILADMRFPLEKTDRWVRNRIRYCIWHNWKIPKRRCKSLIRMGIPPQKAYSWSYTRKGGWATARSIIMKSTVTLSRLHRRGYQSMLSYYESISPYLNEPLYT